MFTTPYFSYFVPVNPAPWATNNLISAQRTVLNLYNQLNYDITRLNTSVPGSARARTLERQITRTENRLTQAENRLVNAVNTAVAYGAFFPGVPGFGPYYYYGATPALRFGTPVTINRFPITSVNRFVGNGIPLTGLTNSGIRTAPTTTTFGGSYNRSWN